MPLKIYSEKNDPPSRIKSVIAIAAGKGGVGKSTVTVNLALALHHLGYSVGIMDTDIYGPSIRKMLPEERLPMQKGSVITPAKCQGIQMISMAFFRKEHESAAVRAPIANSIIAQFIKSVAWGSLDYLLIDFPPGTGDIQLTLTQQANLNGAIMVTTPQEVATLDVRKAMHLFEQLRVPIVGIVENMSYYKHPSGEVLHLFGKGGGEKLCRDTGAPLLGMIPIDPEISRCGDKGLSIFSKQDQTLPSIAQCFIDLANEMKQHLQAIEEESSGCLKQFELIWQDK